MAPQVNLVDSDEDTLVIDDADGRLEQPTGDKFRIGLGEQAGYSKQRVGVPDGRHIRTLVSSANAVVHRPGGDSVMRGGHARDMVGEPARVVQEEERDSSVAHVARAATSGGHAAGDAGPSSVDGNDEKGGKPATDPGDVEVQGDDVQGRIV